MAINFINNFCSPNSVAMAALSCMLFVMLGCSKKPSEKASFREKLEKPVPSVVNSSAIENQPATPPLGSSVSAPSELEKREYEFAQNLPVLIRSEKGVEELKSLLHQASAVISKTATPITDPLVVSGAKLPSNFLDLFIHPNNESPTVAMRKEGFMGIGEKQLYEQQMLGVVCRELTKARPDIVVSFVRGQADSLPPTAADYIIYGAVIEGVQESSHVGSTESGSGTPKTLPQGTPLLNLSQAKNPIYRMLSVKIAPFVEIDDSKLAAFYSSFLNETDAAVQTAAVESLATTRAPNTANALQDFEAKARQQGNKEVADTARQAIQQLNQH